MRSKGQAWKVVDGGVTAAKGYVACGISAGIKKQGRDLAIVFSPSPAHGAAVFTTNCVQAAPVLLSRERLALARGRVQAILMNSGCANACTGPKGLDDAVRTARCLASHLRIAERHVLVASTGAIGTRLPVLRILKSIPDAVNSLNRDGSRDAQFAIMTTDTREKVFAVESTFRRRTVRIGGMAKGAGMIHPQMATMLSVITTDLAAPPPCLKSILRKVVDRTFNCMTVDGDTSTNDMVLLMANGASEASINEQVPSGQFERGLEIVCEELAKSIARDGAGATKFVDIAVTGAPSLEGARQVAKAIAHSLLVKTALCGEQANWGRMLCAAGHSGIPFDPDKVTLRLCGIPVFREGAPVHANRSRAERALKSRDLLIEMNLARGTFGAHVWTCDLSSEYININASYLSRSVEGQASRPFPRALV